MGDRDRCSDSVRDHAAVGEVAVSDVALVEMILWLRARRMTVIVPMRGPVEFKRKRLDQR